MLLWLVDFVENIKQHPQKKFGSTNDECFSKNPFLKRLHFVYCSTFNKQTNDPEVIVALLTWSRTIEKDYILENFEYADFESVRRVTGDEPFTADTRSLTSTLVGLQNQNRNLLVEQRELRRTMDQDRQENKELKEKVDQMHSMLVQLCARQSTSPAASTATSAQGSVNTVVDGMALKQHKDQ
ncbi:MAG: hypothetical protein SGARI_000867 [Bacillariaceae sp.]